MSRVKKHLFLVIFAAHGLYATSDKSAEVWLNYMIRTLELSETLVCRMYHQPSDVDLRTDFLALAAITEDAAVKEKLLLVAHRCKDDNLKKAVFSTNNKVKAKKR